VPHPDDDIDDTGNQVPSVREEHSKIKRRRRPEGKRIDINPIRHSRTHSGTRLSSETERTPAAAQPRCPRSTPAAPSVPARGKTRKVVDRLGKGEEEQDNTGLSLHGPLEQSPRRLESHKSLRTPPYVRHRPRVQLSSNSASGHPRVGASQKAADVIGVLDFGIVDGTIAEDVSGVLQRPEGPRIVANPVGHEPRHAVLIFDMWGLDSPLEELTEIGLADIRA
jgi:hypothetical protein